MSANNIILTLQALFFQPGIQSIKTIEPGGWDEEIPPAVANDTFDIPFVIAFPRAAKPVLKQVVRL